MELINAGYPAGFLYLQVNFFLDGSGNLRQLSNLINGKVETGKNCIIADGVTIEQANRGRS